MPTAITATSQTMCVVFLVFFLSFFFFFLPSNILSVATRCWENPTPRPNRRNICPISEQKVTFNTYVILEMLENDTLWGGTYLYGLFMGVLPAPIPHPPLTPTPRSAPLSLPPKPPHLHTLRLITCWLIQIRLPRRRNQNLPVNAFPYQVIPRKLFTCT